MSPSYEPRPVTTAVTTTLATTYLDQPLQLHDLKSQDGTYMNMRSVVMKSRKEGYEQDESRLVAVMGLSLPALLIKQYLHLSTAGIVISLWSCGIP